MATTAEAYGGARAPWATPRGSEHDMKERARLSGLFPRVRNESLTNTLRGLVKEFEQNAALSALLERRRALEGRSQYELQGREAMDALNRNVAPAFRTGLADAAASARVAMQIAGLPLKPPPAPDAASVMTGGNGAFSVGGSESSTRATGAGGSELTRVTNSTDDGPALAQRRKTPQTTLTGGLAKSKPGSRQRPG